MPKGYKTAMEIQTALLSHKRMGPRWGHEGSPCWDWTLAPDEDGYGRMSINGKMYIVSRVAAWLWKGLTLEDSATQVCHHCDRPICFNPRHLFLGTGKDNAQDSVEKGRSVRGSRNGFATGDEARAEAIRVAIAAGGSQRSVAREFGVCQSTVGRIWRGQKWKHAGGPTRDSPLVTHPAPEPPGAQRG